jgi:hypothetical protein
VLAMDRLPPNTQPPAAGELLLQGALLSLYVGLRSSAWAVGTLERAVGRR